MNTDRTPEDQAMRDTRIQAAIDHATETAAMFILAATYGESVEASDIWLDRVYDHLREALPPGDLIRAIVLLIEGTAKDRANQIRAMVREVDMDDLLPGPWSKTCGCPRCRRTNVRKGRARWR